jgi:Golgi phosphoprotein 3
MSSGLTRRRGAGGGAGGDEGEGSNGAPKPASAANVRDSAPETSYESSENGHKIAFDPRDISESAERSKQPKLTLMEEVILLGIKDKQVHYPFLRHDCHQNRGILARRIIMLT